MDVLAGSSTQTGAQHALEVVLFAADATLGPIRRISWHRILLGLSHCNLPISSREIHGHTRKLLFGVIQAKNYKNL